MATLNLRFEVSALDIFNRLNFDTTIHQAVRNWIETDMENWLNGQTELNKEEVPKLLEIFDKFQFDTDLTLRSLLGVSNLYQLTPKEMQYIETVEKETPMIQYYLPITIDLRRLYEFVAHTIV